MSKKVPIVTVGIPCFNRASGLKRTLEAISAQSYASLDIIVSDNCSPDPAIVRVVEEFMAKDHRISYFRQESNIGALGNFLDLARKGTGDYFMWAADDDWWEEDFILEMVNLLENDPKASLAFSRFIPIEDDYSRRKRYPNFHHACKQFTQTDLCVRLDCFISQREAFGKAHLIYGLMRRDILKKAINITTNNISRYSDVNEFGQFDVLLNAAILSEGHLALSDKLLRRFGSGPRNVKALHSRSIRERLFYYDRKVLVYYDCYKLLIDTLETDETVKRYLKRVVRNKKISYILERLGRRLFVYKLYWHFVKKFSFHTIEEMTKD